VLGRGFHDAAVGVATETGTDQRKLKQVRKMRPPAPTAGVAFSSNRWTSGTVWQMRSQDDRIISLGDWNVSASASVIVIARSSVLA